MKRQRFRLLVLVITLSITLTGCASDPYENAGSCETRGESRDSEGVVQVCIGIDDNLKWYISGRYFDDFQLLGKIVYGSDFDIAQPDIRDSDLWEYALQYEKLAVTSEDIASYAEGDTRWDGVIEAIADKNTEREIQDYLMDERFSARIEWQKGNLSQQKAYEAQQEQVEHMNGPLDEADRNFDRKIAVLMADIVNKYGIENKRDATIFALKILKNQDTSKG
jgi:hypothetical protein